MKNYTTVFLGAALLLASTVFGQNPIIRDQFTADPTARVFNGKVYLFPSHDIIAPSDKGLRENWFCMEDYHVFSSENLTDWTDHGMIVTQTKVPWLTNIRYDMWAPDCVFKNGKYYFYFPVGGRIGVATADKPEGPYTVLDQPVAGIGGIDPCVLIDKDGQAYIFTSMNRISVAKLKENMIEVDGPAQTIELPKKGLLEGPFAFERNGKYYLTYPHVENKTERLEYAIADNPMGPYKHAGVLMDESESGCWTNHHSLINYKDQWYLFYHDMDYSPKFDKNRSSKIDSLFFNADGTIQKVKPTHRGVGVTKAASEIQIDRYTKLSDKGASVAYLDTTNYFAGWKTILDGQNAWVQYNTVDFGDAKFKKVQLKALSANGGTAEIRIDKVDGPVIAKVTIPKSSNLSNIEAKVSKTQKGIHNLFVVMKDSKAEIDWVKFVE